jgi:hypothetical protein
LSEIALQAQGVFAFNEPEIVDELKLTRDQRTAIRQIIQDLFARPWRPPEHEPVRDKGRGPSAEAMEKAVARAVDILNPEQARRWRELTGSPFADALELRQWGRHGGKPPGPPPRPSN